MKRKAAVALAAILLINGYTTSYGLDMVSETAGEVASKGLNIRTGPGIEHRVIKSLYEGEKFNILGKMDLWYLIQLEDKTVGMVYGDYVRVTEIETEGPMEGDGEIEAAEEEEDVFIFELVNRTRLEENLKAFQWDDKLNEIARLKAKDIAEQGYFGHLSPKYGTPFKMIKNMGVEYRSASENIAGNQSYMKAHESLMASEAHRGNILNSRFNKMGVGISKSDEYGYIIVQIFIEE